MLPITSKWKNGIDFPFKAKNIHHVHCENIHQQECDNQAINMGIRPQHKMHEM